jgi:hypothetical protein
LRLAASPLTRPRATPLLARWRGLATAAGEEVTSKKNPAGPQCPTETATAYQIRSPATSEPGYEQGKSAVCTENGRSGRYLQFVAKQTRSETARRAEKRRREKLKAVQEQIADGSLKIRKMTKAEREKYPPRKKEEKDS